MALEGILREVCQEYLPARLLTPAEFARLRNLVEAQATDLIGKLLPQKRYKVRGHTIQGLIADAPWIGIHDDRVDSNPTTGVYVALIFRIDGSGLALSLQHGTENRGIKEIRTQTEILAGQVLLPNATFHRGVIRIRPPGSEFAAASRPGKYENASIFGKEYNTEEITDQICADILAATRSYGEWVSPILLNDQDTSYQEVDDLKAPNLDELPAGRLERQVVRAGSLYPPRDPRHGVFALHRAEYLCEVDSSHPTFLRPNGHRYMEKHHLIPMEHYFRFEQSIDHHLNIYSLCPLCHRRIHHATAQERQKLVELLYDRRAEMFAKVYSASLDAVRASYH